jgi:pimeloyl-ACP methyl ester carboxylesterase
MNFLDINFVPPWKVPESFVLFTAPGESEYSWNHWIGRLGEDHRVLIPMIRNRIIAGDWTMPRVLDEIEHGCRERKITKVHLVGQRAGANVALDFANRFPKLVTSLTLICPIFTGDHEIFRWHSQLLESKGIAGWAEATIRQRFGSESPMARWWTEEIQKVGKERLQEIHKYICGINFKLAIESCDLPCLLLSTDRSKIGRPSEFSQVCEKKSQVRLCILPDDSYSIQYNDPVLCMNIMFKFISGQGS